VEDVQEEKEIRGTYTCSDKEYPGIGGQGISLAVPRDAGIVSHILAPTAVFDHQYGRVLRAWDKYTPSSRWSGELHGFPIRIRENGTCAFSKYRTSIVFHQVLTNISG